MMMSWCLILRYVLPRHQGIGDRGSGIRNEVDDRLGRSGMDYDILDMPKKGSFIMELQWTIFINLVPPSTASTVCPLNPSLYSAHPFLTVPLLPFLTVPCAPPFVTHSSPYPSHPPPRPPLHPLRLHRNLFLPTRLNTRTNLLRKSPSFRGNGTIRRGIEMDLGESICGCCGGCSWLGSLAYVP